MAPTLPMQLEANFQESNLDLLREEATHPSPVQLPRDQVERQHSAAEFAVNHAAYY